MDDLNLYVKDKSQFSYSSEQTKLYQEYEEGTWSKKCRRIFMTGGCVDKFEGIKVPHQGKMLRIIDIS